MIEARLILKTLTDRLSDTGVPQQEAKSTVLLIVKYYTGFSFAEILSGKQTSIEVNSLIDSAFNRIIEEYPVQYILGETEFYGRKFIVNNSTLIPRPETEELVSLIVSDFAHKPLSILDIGTGSGCIAVTLDCELANAKVHATDISEKALQTAEKNSILNCASVIFAKHDILSDKNCPFFTKFDLIVSNPPYVCESEMQYMKNNVLKHEPFSALFVSDSEPLIFYKACLHFASDYLKDKGFIYVEINENFGQETLKLFEDSGYRAELIKDIYGKNRFVKSQKK
ncbi:MAG: peptide chain release factor N(5)-glutamine methyltransferase [Prevotellaceae bacterium]|jgi:release factor glutamine methyltransferase|nr:peptide chain release factor N(5)-glutamine methyltransferase [Prevotellaceae bacterium]